MKPLSCPDGEQVLDHLGVPFVHACLDAVDGARADFADYRAWQPSWFSTATSRTTANMLHDRIWDHLTRGVDGMENVRVVDSEPTREIYYGMKYRIRVKRHLPGDKISAYPTAASRTFWRLDTETLEGFELFSLALGYRWDPDLREVGEAIVSLRNGMTNPIWAMELTRNTKVTTGFSWMSVEPELAALDLSAVVAQVKEEGSS